MSYDFYIERHSIFKGAKTKEGNSSDKGPGFRKTYLKNEMYKR
jgi:hypothetical protein